MGWLKTFFYNVIRFLFCAWIAGAGQAWGEVTLPEAKHLWMFPLNGSHQYFPSSSSLALAPDGTIYQGTFGGALLAITPDGKEKWRFQTGLEIKSSPSIAEDGTIYFGSRDRHLYALAPDGKLKWKFATGGWVDSSPAIGADGTIYFGSWDGFFYALKRDGSLKWKYPVKAVVEASAAIAKDGTVYFGAHDHFFYALNPDGTPRWRFQTGGQIIGSSAIGWKGEIYVSSLDGNLYALKPEGTEIWRCHTGSTTASSPVLDENGSLCVGHNTCTLVISKDGRNLWHSGAAVPVDVSAIAVSGQFYISVPWQTLQAVQAPDQRIWNADLKTRLTASPNLDERGILYCTAGGYLHAIQPPDKPLPPANSSWPMFQANAQHTGRVAK